MFRHSTNTSSFFSILMTALIFSPSLAVILRPRATLVLGQARFRTTPRASYTARHAHFETITTRLDALELRNNHSIQITAEKTSAIR